MQLMRYSALYPMLVLCLCLAGCASTKSGSGQEPQKPVKSTFNTPLVTANFSLRSGKFANALRVTYQVRSECTTPNCVPSKFMLSFFVNPGSKTLFLSNRSLFIRAGKESYRWQKKTLPDIRTAQPVQGIITSVTLNREQLMHIAKLRMIAGKLAGFTFEWSYKNRKPLRNLLNKMKKVDTGQ